MITAARQISHVCRRVYLFPQIIPYFRLFLTVAQDIQETLVDLYILYPFQIRLLQNNILHIIEIVYSFCQKQVLSRWCLSCCTNCLDRKKKKAISLAVYLQSDWLI